MASSERTYGGVSMSERRAVMRHAAEYWKAKSKAGEKVAGSVAHLASEKCPFTGKIFMVQGGSIQELTTWSVSRGIETDGPWTIEEIAEQTADWK